MLALTDANSTQPVVPAVDEMSEELREAVLTRRDGERVAVAWRASPIDVDGSEAGGLLVIVSDLPDRRALLAACKRYERNRHSLAESLSEGIVIQRDGRVAYVNTAFFSMLGYADASAILDRPIFDLVHQDDRHPLAARFRALSRSSAPAPARPYRLLRIDGAVLTVDLSAVVALVDGAWSILMVARDVTEQRAMQAKLILSDRLASVGTLAAGIGNEINNPLSFVLGNLELAVDEIVQMSRVAEEAMTSRTVAQAQSGCHEVVRRMGSVNDALSEARVGAERVRIIVRDLRAFSRVDEEPKLPVDLRQAVESSINMAWNEIKHRARLVKDYAETPLVEGHYARIGQVALNLLINAAHAIPEGASDRNEIRIATRTDELGHAVLEVRDTGMGIPQEIIRRVFDPFFTTKPVGLGTGLGLSICHTIATNLGGHMEVESEVGKGSTFRLVLPPANLEVTPRVDANILPRVAEPVAPVPRRRVMVVDDEPAALAMLARAFGNDHDVAGFGRARDALRHLETGGTADVVFCDLMMPEMTGMDFHEAVVARWPEFAARFVFMTGGAFTPAARSFLDRVPNPRLEKPFHLKNARAMLEAVGR